MYEEYKELVRLLKDKAEKFDYDGWVDTAVVMEKAADAIEELSKPSWIPVTEALPEPYTWVLVSAEKHEVAFDAFYDGAQWKDAVLNGLIVTHWMPLPEPRRGLRSAVWWASRSLRRGSLIRRM